EDGRLATRGLDEGHGPLGGQKAEAREVLDVLVVEEDVAGELVVSYVLEQALAAPCELLGRDPRRRPHRPDLRRRSSCGGIDLAARKFTRTSEFRAVVRGKNK